MIDLPAQPISLRISVTDRCQHRCLYCLPTEGVDLVDHRDVLRHEQICRLVRAVTSCVSLGKVHITGGEPLLRRGIVDLVEMLAAEGVSDLAMTTNGRRLTELSQPLKQAGLMRVNVSLDTLNEQTYAHLTRGGRLDETGAGIQAARLVGLDPVKINTVVLRGINDEEVVDLADWAVGRGCRIRFLELMPIGCAQERFEELHVPASEVRQHLAQFFTLRPLEYRAGASSRDFRALGSNGREGIIGFIAPLGSPSCSGCRRLRLTSTGQLISCLARGEGADVKALLDRSDDEAEQEVARIVMQQLASKRIPESFDTRRAMASVGG